MSDTTRDISSWLRIAANVLECVRMPKGVKSTVPLCADVAAASGEDPAGSAWASDRYFAIEVPLPWPNNMLESRGMPPGAYDLVQRLFDERIYWGWIGIAPDPDYSVEGMTRVIDFRLPSEPPFHQYERREYLFPIERFGTLAELMAFDPESPALAPYRRDIRDVRDLLVCTHGTVDVCCGTYGYPIYRLLRHIASTSEQDTRVWRCTHFGGHRFAATLLDLPQGRYWGQLTANDLAPLVRRNGSFADLSHCYRGWSALPHPSQQIAEAEIFRKTGWTWIEWELVPLGAVPVDQRPVDVHEVTFLIRHRDSGEERTVTATLTPSRIVHTMTESKDQTREDIQHYDVSFRGISPDVLLRR